MPRRPVTRLWLALFALGLLAPAAHAAAADEPGTADIRRALTLLSHVGEEYREGVVDGRVVRPVEYEEAVAFLDEAESRLAGAAPAATAAAAPAFAQVRTGLHDKVPGDQVREQLAALSAAVSSRTGVSEPVFPPAPPSASRGRALFTETCAGCHGAHADGRGPNAARLDPPPASFAGSCAEARSRSTARTFAPSCTKRITVARPLPMPSPGLCPAPITMAILSFRRTRD